MKFYININGVNFTSRPLSPVVNISIPHDDSNSAGRSLQNGGHSRLDSDDEGYPGSSDCLTSVSDIDPGSPKMRALASLSLSSPPMRTPSPVSPGSPLMRTSTPLSPASHVARPLGCPFSQGQLKESRVLAYLKSLRGFDKQEMETPETQFTHLLQVTSMQVSVCFNRQLFVDHISVRYLYISKCIVVQTI